MSPTDSMPRDSEDGFTFSYRSGEDGQPMLGIIDAVARTKDVSPTELEPLHYSIGVDELNGLFGRTDSANPYRSSSDSTPANHAVTFEYEGCNVRVTPDVVHIEPP